MPYRMSTIVQLLSQTSESIWSMRRNCEKCTFKLWLLFYSVSVVPLSKSKSKKNDERKRLQLANSSAKMKKREKGQLNNNKMDDKWNMELSTAKTYLPRVLKAKKKKKRFLLSLPHIGSIFMFRKPEETIKIERNKIEMLLRNNFCSLSIRSFRHWHQQVRCVYETFSSLLSI